MTKMNNMIIAETDRLILRWLIPKDIDEVAMLYADPDVMKYSPKGPIDRGSAEERLNANRDSYVRWGFGMYAVILKEYGFVGICGLNRFDDVEGQLEHEIGFRIHRRHWNQGITTEAASAVRDYGFSDVGFTRLVSIVAPDNVPSVRVAEKVGMTFEKPVHFLGMDLHLYAIHKDLV